MGPSGCGKTTLFSCIIGAKNLDSGSIEIFREPPKVNKPRIGYMPQESALINDFTIRENLWFFGTIYGMKKAKINERAHFLIDLLELQNEEKLVRDCSGGEKRRISLALSLVHEPELLVLDEPTVGVDPLLRNKIWLYLAEISTSQNITVLMSTHYIEEANQSTHVGILRNGVILVEDNPQNVLRSMQTSNLEEAFLKLSENQVRQDMNRLNSSDTTELPEKVLESQKADTSSKVRKRIRIQSFNVILSAMLMKNYLKIVRNIE